MFCFLLTATMFAQDEVGEAVIHRSMDGDESLMQVQIAKGDKQGAMLSSCWAISDFNENLGFDDVEVNWINLANTSSVFFFVNYTAQYTTNVRFRMVVTGPEFYMRTSETWYGAKYKTNSLYYVYGPKSNFFKTKGEYTVIFIAEQQKPYGGSDLVASCKIRVY